MRLFRPFQLLLLLIIAMALIACRESNQVGELDSYNIEMTLSDSSPTVGDEMLMFVVTDEAGNPVNDLTLDIKGDMTHAGMVPVLAETSQGSEGQYRVPFEWTMGGDWIVTVDFTDADGGTTQRRFDVVVGGEMVMDEEGEMDMGEEGEMDHSEMDMGEEGEMDHSEMDMDEEGDMSMDDNG